MIFAKTYKFSVLAVMRSINVIAFYKYKIISYDTHSIVSYPIFLYLRKYLWITNKFDLESCASCNRKTDNINRARVKIRNSP